MTTKTKKVMEEEIDKLDSLINSMTQSSDFDCAADTGREEVHEFHRQSIIRILETAMGEIKKIEIVESPTKTITINSDQVFVVICLFVIDLVKFF